MSGVLLVTGASRGIGAATALAGARAGYAVAVHYGVHLGEADAVCAKILSNGGKAIVVQGDMASETDIVSMFKTIDSELGTITALVNNAGSVIAVRAIADIDSSIIDRILAVNLAGPISCGGKGGAIVNISSMAALLGGLPNEVPYAATKGGVDSLTIGLAREVATQGIRVNAIRPGVIDTPIHAFHGEGFIERFSPNLPMQRAGTADEVAEAAIWLLSSAASYVTGSILNVSGGR